jgi:hypothetical protein
MDIVKCPRCGEETTQLESITGSLGDKIREARPEEQIPEQVCLKCFSQLATGVSRGSILAAKERAKESQKLSMWNARVGLIKKAKMKMDERSYSEAAVLYEKYFRILENVFDVPDGGLTPDVFKDAARTKELTIVSTTLWDLVRIYDTSEKYGNRMVQAANKLSLFLKYTPIYPDVIRKAEAFSKTAKNPQVIRDFLKQAGDTKARCFIATAAFESEYEMTVIELRFWRDHKLLKSNFGRNFVKLYELISPMIASLLDRCPKFKPPVRWLLQHIARIVN